MATLTLNELIDIVLLESGQFLYGDQIENVLGCLNIDKRRFYNSVVKRSLAEYEKYKPRVDKLNVTISDRFYQFSAPAPDLVISVTPVDTQNINLLSPFTHPFGFTITKHDGGIMHPLAPRKFIWEYRNPKLYASEDGAMDIEVIREHDITLSETADGQLIDATIDGLCLSDNTFIDLVTAYFIIALGRSRRTVIANELPVTFDGAEMVQEGLDMLDIVKEALHNSADFYLSLGV